MDTGPRVVFDGLLMNGAPDIHSLTGPEMDALDGERSSWSGDVGQSIG